MSYHPRTPTSGLRWREDTGIEKRCESCPNGLRWWPLTVDFWDFRKSFVRCRACFAKVKSESQGRRSRDERVRQARNAYKREYDAATADVRRIKNQVYYWAAPERHRAEAKARYYRDRERILEQKRLRYWATRDAA